MKSWKIWTILVLGLLMLIIVLQNTAVVETQILFFTIALPRALLLFLTLLIGFLLGLYVSVYRRRRSGSGAKDFG